MRKIHRKKVWVAEADYSEVSQKRLLKVSSSEFLHVREPSALSDKYLPHHKVMISSEVLLSQITRNPRTGPLKLNNLTDISTVLGLKVTSSLIFLAFLS